MNDETADPAPGRIPKYKAPDFMRNEIALFMNARNATVMARRFGDDDSPVPPVGALRPLSAVRRVTAINRQIR